MDSAVRDGRLDLPTALSKFAWVQKDNKLAIGHLASAVPTEADDGDMSIPFVVSVLTEDRDGDVVIPRGCQLSNFSHNPVGFFGHQQHPIPIVQFRSPDGRITVTPEDDRIRAVAYFDREDPDSCFIYGKVKRGFLNATSIAFVPIDAERRDRGEEKGMYADRAHPHSTPMGPPGWLFKAYDLTEISIVGVPSNAGAIRESLAREVDFSDLRRMADEAGEIRDSLDREKQYISKGLYAAMLPYAAKAYGRCFSGWAPDANGVCVPCETVQKAPARTPRCGSCGAPAEATTDNEGYSDCCNKRIVHPDTFSGAKNDEYEALIARTKPKKVAKSQDASEQPDELPDWEVFVDGKVWRTVQAYDEQGALETAKYYLDQTRRAQMPKDYSEEDFRQRFPKPKLAVKGPYHRGGARVSKAAEPKALLPVPPRERWNKSLSEAFDAMPELELGAPDKLSVSTSHRVAAKYIGCEIKHLQQASTMVPSPRMGSFLMGLSKALEAYRLVEVRNLSDRSEAPPVYEALQLDSKQRAKFLVQGTAFYESMLPRGKRAQPGQVQKGSGPHNARGRSSGQRFAVKFSPEWGGLNVKAFSYVGDPVAQDVLDQAWVWAKEHNFLKGEAFALSGEFLPRSAEGWADVILEAENKAICERTVSLFNSKGVDFANRGLILTGPPGTGKTLSGRIIRNTAKGTFIWVSSRDFHASGSVGGLSLAFEMAKELAPSIIFMEDVDNWLHPTTIDLLKSEMDGIGRYKGVLTILTTNFPEQLPDALIDRPGRFHDVLQFDLPSADARSEMLTKWLPEVREEQVAIAVSKTAGYSGAHCYELAKFAKDLCESDGLQPADALEAALAKVAKQRELITNLQLNGSNYNPLRARQRGVPVKLTKSLGGSCACGNKGACSCGTVSKAAKSPELAIPCPRCGGVADRLSSGKYFCGGCGWKSKQVTNMHETAKKGLSWRQTSSGNYTAEQGKTTFTVYQPATGKNKPWYLMYNSGSGSVREGTQGSIDDCKRAAEQMAARMGKSARHAVHKGDRERGDKKFLWEIWVDGKYYGTEWANTKAEAEQTARTLGAYAAYRTVEARNPKNPSKSLTVSKDAPGDPMKLTAGFPQFVSDADDRELLADNAARELDAWRREVHAHATLTKPGGEADTTARLRHRGTLEAAYNALWQKLIQLRGHQSFAIYRTNADTGQTEYMGRQEGKDEADAVLRYTRANRASADRGKITASRKLKPGVSTTIPSPRGPAGRQSTSAPGSLPGGSAAHALPLWHVTTIDGNHGGEFRARDANAARQIAGREWGTDTARIIAAATDSELRNLIAQRHRNQSAAEQESLRHQQHRSLRRRHKTFAELEQLNPDAAATLLAQLPVKPGEEVSVEEQGDYLYATFRGRRFLYNRHTRRWQNTKGFFQPNVEANFPVGAKVAIIAGPNVGKEGVVLSHANSSDLVTYIQVGVDNGRTTQPSALGGGSGGQKLLDKVTVTANQLKRKSLRRKENFRWLQANHHDAYVAFEKLGLNTYAGADPVFSEQGGVLEAEFMGAKYKYDGMRWRPAKSLVRKYSVGDRVRITAGEYSGAFGRVIRVEPGFLTVAMDIGGEERISTNRVSYKRLQQKAMKLAVVCLKCGAASAANTANPAMKEGVKFKNFCWREMKNTPHIVQMADDSTFRKTFKYLGLYRGARMWQLVGKAGKFKVGDKVSVGDTRVEDAEIVRLVADTGRFKKNPLYQVEYHIVGDPPGKRHQQPWSESEIRPKSLRVGDRVFYKGRVRTVRRGWVGTPDRTVRLLADDSPRGSSYYWVPTNSPDLAHALSKPFDSQMDAVRWGRAKQLLESSGPNGGFTVSTEQGTASTTSPGGSICIDCAGSGHCVGCNGAGCAACDSTGECPTCEGEGTMAAKSNKRARRKGPGLTGRYDPRTGERSTQRFVIADADEGLVQGSAKDNDLTIQQVALGEWRVSGDPADILTFERDIRNAGMKITRKSLRKARKADKPAIDEINEGAETHEEEGDVDKGDEEAFQPKESALKAASYYKRLKDISDEATKDAESVDHPGMADAFKELADKHLAKAMAHTKDALAEHHGKPGDDPDELMAKHCKALDGMETGETNLVEHGEVPPGSDYETGGKSWRKAFDGEEQFALDDEEQFGLDDEEQFALDNAGNEAELTPGTSGDLTGRDIAGDVLEAGLDDVGEPGPANSIEAGLDDEEQFGLDDVGEPGPANTLDADVDDDEEERSITDPDSDEILERYQHPKHGWCIAKASPARVAEVLLSGGRVTQLADGRKFLVARKTSEQQYPSMQFFVHEEDAKKSAELSNKKDPAHTYTVVYNAQYAAWEVKRKSLQRKGPGLTGRYDPRTGERSTQRFVIADADEGLIQGSAKDNDLTIQQVAHGEWRVSGDPADILTFERDIRNAGMKITRKGLARRRKALDNAGNEAELTPGANSNLGSRDITGDTLEGKGIDDDEDEDKALDDEEQFSLDDYGNPDELKADDPVPDSLERELMATKQASQQLHRTLRLLKLGSRN